MSTESTPTPAPPLVIPSVEELARIARDAFYSNPAAWEKAAWETTSQTILALFAPLVAEVERWRKEAAELQQTFDLQWQADQLAIKRWQAETGKTDVWPDRADMVVWLLGKLDEEFPWSYGNAQQLRAEKAEAALAEAQAGAAGLRHAVAAIVAIRHIAKPAPKAKPTLDGREGALNEACDAWNEQGRGEAVTSDLTRDQAQVYRCLEEMHRANGFMPTTREVQKKMGFASQTSVVRALAGLERKGWIVRPAGRHRAIFLRTSERRLERMKREIRIALEVMSVEERMDFLYGVDGILAPLVNFTNPKPSEK